MVYVHICCRRQRLNGRQYTSQCDRLRYRRSCCIGFVTRLRCRNRHISSFQDIQLYHIIHFVLYRICLRAIRREIRDRQTTRYCRCIQNHHIRTTRLTLIFTCPTNRLRSLQNRYRDLKRYSLIPIVILRIKDCGIGSHTLRYSNSRILPTERTGDIAFHASTFQRRSCQGIRQYHTGCRRFCKNIRYDTTNMEHQRLIRCGTPVLVSCLMSRNLNIAVALNIQ